MSSLYVDGSTPAWYYSALNPILAGQDPNRLWYSQPRAMTSTFAEVLKVNFRSPVSIDFITFELLQRAQSFEVWYYDRQGVRRQVLDRSFKHYAGQIPGSTSSAVSWRLEKRLISPVIATKLELVLRRVYDSSQTDTTTPFSLGVKTFLAKRSIENRTDALVPFEDDVDPIGNLVSRTVLDWNPEKAVDGSRTTFWRSAPQPTPDAVVSMYLDVRDKAKLAQTIDRLYLDPVHTGSTLNVYYSNDSTVGTRRLSTTALVPKVQTNVPWTKGSGLNFDSSTALLKLKTDHLGVETGDSFWFGLEWTPNFIAGSGSDVTIFESFEQTPANSTTLSANMTTTTPGTIAVASTTGWPTIFPFNLAIGSGATLEVVTVSGVSGTNVTLSTRGVNGTTAQTHSAGAGIVFDSGPRVLKLEWIDGGTKAFRVTIKKDDGTNATLTTTTQTFQKNEVRRLVLRVVQDSDSSSSLPRGVYLDSYTESQKLGLQSLSIANIQTRNYFDEVLQFTESNGTLNAFLLKREVPTLENANLFGFSPQLYLTPDPVLEIDDLDRQASSTLDNAIIGADLREQEIFYGGLDEAAFTSKEWTPIWRDFTTYRGFYYFPEPVTCKYLKLEFSSLTEEPYPIWESGREVVYRTWPVSVLETTKAISKYTEWTYSTAVDGRIGELQQTNSDTQTVYAYDINISIGAPLDSTSIRNTVESPPEYSVIKEASSSTVFDQTTNSSVNTYATTTTSTKSTKKVVDAQYYTVVKGDTLEGIGRKLGIPWQTVYKQNKRLIDTDRRVAMLPKRSPGWWIFPGQKFRISEAVMKTITTTKKKVVATPHTVEDRSTGIERKESTETRKRFTTTIVHRYDTQKVERTVAIAYFAGISEVQVYTGNYIASTDEEQYKVTRYTDDRFSLVNTSLNTGTGVTSVATGSTNCSMISTVWASTSQFARLEIDAIDKGFEGRRQYSPTLSAYGTAGVAGTWLDPTAKWSDTSVTWGADAPLVGVDEQSNYQFAGSNASRLVKSATPSSGTGGIKTEDSYTNVPVEARIRLEARVFRTDATNNVYKLQLIDNTSAVLFEEVVEPELGRWSTLTTSLYKNTTTAKDVTVRLVLTGTDAETSYISSLGLELTTIVYEVSSDGGTNYYECTNVVNKPDGYFTFPSPGKQLRLRVRMWRATDYAYGVTLRPLYLQ
jgi:LysM repeat protein